MTKLSYLIIATLMTISALANDAHGLKVPTPGQETTTKKNKSAKTKSPKKNRIRRRRLTNTQQNEEGLKMKAEAHPTSSHHATPFGEIEEVFVDTLKEDEEYTRRMQTVVQPLSFEFVVLENVEVEPVEVEVVEVPKCAQIESHSGPSKGRGKRGYKYGPGKGKGKRGYKYGPGKGKGKSNYGYGGYGPGGKGKGKKGDKVYQYSESSSGESDEDKLATVVNKGTVVAIEEITYYGSGPNAKPCIYGDPKHPCPFSGPQDDDGFNA